MFRFADLSAPAKWSIGAIALAAVAVPSVFALAQDAPAKDPPLTAEQVTKARQLFADNSCGGCHTLADAEGSGAIGPSLDGNTGLTQALVVDRVTNGSGPMPSFGGQIEEADINLLARYVVQAKK